MSDDQVAAALEANKREIEAGRELHRVRGLQPSIRRQMTQLTVWCETGSCTVARVYRVKGELLLDVYSPESRHRQPERAAFFHGYRGHWLTGPDGRVTILDHRQAFTCPCDNTTVRHLDPVLVAAAAQDGTTRNLSVLEVQR